LHDALPISLAGNLRLRPGASPGRTPFRAGSGALHRLRLRLGAAAPDHAALRRGRPAPVLRRRPALPAPVQRLVSDTESESCNFPNHGCAPGPIPTSTARNSAIG